MSSRLRAIDNHLPQLEHTIERLVTAISGECLTKKIISKDTYQNVLQSGKTKRDKTLYLLSKVWKTIRDDDEKCQQFIQILESHKSCRDVVTKIKQDIEAFTDRSVTAQESQGTFITKATFQSKQLVANDNHKSSPCLHLIPEQRQTRYHISAMVTGTSLKIDARLRESRIDPEVQAKQYAKMDQQQLEAKLAELQKANEQIIAESKEVQKERDITNRKRAELEEKLKSKDMKLDKVSTEKDDLKLSMDLLRKKMSRAEKKRYIAENVANQISKYEQTIIELQHEKRGLTDNFQKISKKYECLRDRVDLLETIAMQYDVMLQELSHQEPQSPPLETWPYCNIRNTLVTTIIVILLVIMGIVILYVM